MISSKAQVAMIDLILAFVIAFGLVTILLAYIDQPTNEINSRVQVEDKLIKAIEASTILLNSYGEPVSWDTISVQIPSIIKSQNNIDAIKLKKFRSLDYEKKKHLLNLNNFNYTLIIKLNNTEIFDGKNSTESDVITVNRLALYEEEDATIQLKVW